MTTTFLSKEEIDALMVRVEKDLRYFVGAMRYKLRKNAHKGRWEDASVPDMLRLLKQEVEELEEAIGRGADIEIVLESADVANMALILSVIATERATAREK